MFGFRLLGEKRERGILQRSQSNKKMKYELNKNIELTEDGDNIPSDIYLIENEHQLQVELNESNRYVNFIFSSRLAMYEFGKAIMHEAIFGEGGFQEFYPMEVEASKPEIINGVRMNLDSARLFICRNP